MSLTNDQLEDRIIAIEAVVNDLQTAVNLLATKAMLKQLVNIRQAEMDNLTTRVAALESAVKLLQSA